MTHESDIPGHTPDHTANAPVGSVGVRVAVFAQSADCVDKANQISQRLGVECCGPVKPDPQLCDLALTVDPRGLSLTPLTGERDLTHGNPVRIDWSGIDTVSGAGRSLDQPLLKAIGLKSREAGPVVIDGTAGLGEDSYVMASLGAKVTMLERQPVVALMLQEHLARLAARQSPLASRMKVEHAHAGLWLTPARVASLGVDVVYLDFMFPTGRKSAERKQMKVLRMLAGADDDATQVLAAAIASGVGRVVVKRPLHAQSVPGPQVTHQILAKSLRFDVYLAHGRS